MDNEITIAETTNFVTLEQAITEGNKGFIPYEFAYPNTDMIVELKLKPITNPDLQDAIQSRKLTGNSLDVELLKISLYNPDETMVDEETIMKLPAGVVAELSAKVAEISGLKADEKAQDQMMKELMGF